ncbi:hypothetical protein [Pinibacter soli]|uniref:Uncharacterized protein n=1 Tax=Pinibacter soli TaxID=3044211 RepID=A0ABT6RGF9_9BACT|nr:hypothetical protein [Pinibacter soli]MDI3320954.1 hypothetical protein [Pinibacter soli]
MKPILSKKSRSFFAAVAITTVFSIVFTAGLFCLFFDKKLNEFFIYLDEHIKAISILVKIIVFVSAIIWLVTPIIIACLIYTFTKDHYDSRKTSIIDRIKSTMRKSKWISPQIETLGFNSNFDDNDFDNFAQSELKKLQCDLTTRRDEYLSIYKGGPLFLSEARERFKNKMSGLLDYQDEVILSMHIELHSQIKTRIRYYKKQMKNAEQTDVSSLHLLSDYSNQMDDFYSEIYSNLEKELADLNIQLQELSDDHLDKLQNLSTKFSSY